jgi:hypothetical protein
VRKAGIILENIDEIIKFHRANTGGDGGSRREPPPQARKIEDDGEVPF